MLDSKIKKLPAGVIVLTEAQMKEARQADPTVPSTHSHYIYCDKKMEKKIKCTTKCENGFSVLKYVLDYTENRLRPVEARCDNNLITCDSGGNIIPNKFPDFKCKPINDDGQGSGDDGGSGDGGSGDDSGDSGSGGSGSGDGGSTPDPTVPPTKRRLL